MDRIFFLSASLLGGLSVAFGAFGAHALRDRLEPGMLANFQTGVTYQFYHVLALFAVFMAIGRWPNSNLPSIAGWLFIAGILFFSGSLYLMAFSGQRWLGAITPIGGVALIGGWVCLALAAWQGR